MGETTFWGSSPRDLLEVLELDSERRRWAKIADDWRAGLVAAEVANAGPWDPQGKERWEPRDFFPDLPEPERRPQPWQQMRAILAGFNARGGGNG